MGAVVLPCLMAGGYPVLKLPVSSPTGLFCLPSRAIWVVNREERLREPNSVSLIPEPVAFSSGRAPAFILPGFCLFPQMRAAMVAVSDRVWYVLWETSSLLAASSGIWLTWEQIPASDIFFFFCTLEAIPLASRVMDHPITHHSAQGMFRMSVPST